MAKDTEIIKPFYNSRNLPPKVVFCSKNPSKVQISPLDAISPQDVLERHGMYKEQSVYAQHPEKIYGDLTNLGSYEDIMNQKRSMEEKFNNLDIDVRARFNHSVDQFVKFCNSKDFSIEKVLSNKELDRYNAYKEEQARLKAYEDYKKSSAYQDNIAEIAQRQQYETEMYEKWKSENMRKK